MGKHLALLIYLNNYLI